MYIDEYADGTRAEYKVSARAIMHRGKPLKPYEGASWGRRGNHKTAYNSMHIREQHIINYA